MGGMMLSYDRLFGNRVGDGFEGWGCRVRVWRGSALGGGSVGGRFAGRVAHDVCCLRMRV